MMKTACLVMTLLLASCGSISRSDGTPVVDALVALEQEHTATLEAFTEVVKASEGSEETKAAVYSAIGESGRKYRMLSQATLKAVAALMEVDYQRLYEQAIAVGGSVWAEVKK